MAQIDIEKRLLRVSKLQSVDLKLLREGVSLETNLARTLPDTMMQVVADRLILAETFLQMADRMKRSRSHMWRPAIARYYYAMYHSMRAVSFSQTSGDDHQAHGDLFVKGIPKDFPNSSDARNSLKNARLLRNEADYDPYPTNVEYYRSTCQSLAPTAKLFVRHCREYLISKGNLYL